MGASTFPAAAAGTIKSVQRGQATTAGNITISAVDVSKSFVKSFSNGSAGEVAGDGSESGTFSASGGTVMVGGGNYVGPGGSWFSLSGTRNYSGGTTNLTTKVYGVYLSNATTLVATGACYWEVVEYL